MAGQHRRALDWRWALHESVVGQRSESQFQHQSLRAGPIAEIEAQYGPKAGVPRGLEMEGNSICTVSLAQHMLKLLVSPPGTEGVPTSIKMGLEGPR